jgi:hypothetical protein
MEEEEEKETPRKCSVECYGYLSHEEREGELMW